MKHENCYCHRCLDAFAQPASPAVETYGPDLGRVRDVSPSLSKVDAMLWEALCALRGLSGSDKEKAASEIEAHFGVSPVVQPASRHGITIDFKQATELLAMFGGEPSEITLRVCNGTAGEGLYAHYTEYPEEGSNYLGVSDGEAAPAPASPAVEVASEEHAHNCSTHYHANAKCDCTKGQP